MAGSKPGERRGGRQKGTPNKATAEIKEVARLHGVDAVNRLAHLMMHADSEAAQVAAANSLLDRGYGKAAQALTGEDGGAIEVIAKLTWADSKSGK